MKRASILFLGLLLMSGVAYAEVTGGEVNDRVGHLDLGIEGGGAFIGASGLDDTGWIQANTSYGVTPWLGLGFETGWTEADNDFGGTTGIVEMMGDIIVRWVNHPWDTRLVPYADLGLGMHWTYAEVDNQNDRDESSFAWKLGGGLDWWLNDNWILNFDVSYHDSSDKLPVNHLASNDESTSFTTLTGGLKFVF
jgi:opacity protein-like surface antigen